MEFRDEERVFITGNEVVARAAQAAGAGYLFGYPITPQNEIMHHWRHIASQAGRGFLQTEDELSAGFATLGAVLTGKIAFSATAGPGTILFQEPLSMAEAMRLPLVIIVQQRGGPSTATVIYSQQEVTLTCFGGNGEGLRIVYSTSSHQELYDYTIKAFRNAWKYRFPAIVLGDGYQAKMREELILYDPSSRAGSRIPNEPIIGGEQVVHMQNAFSVEEELGEKLLIDLEDYNRAIPVLVEHEFLGGAGGRLLVVAHGIVGRAARQAVKELQARGDRVNFFRPITLRPFPEEHLVKACQQSGNAVLVAESAEGQLGRLVRLALADQVLTSFRSYYRPGLGITSEEILEEARL